MKNLRLKIWELHRFYYIRVAPLRIRQISGNQWKDSDWSVGADAHVTLPVTIAMKPRLQNLNASMVDVRIAFYDYEALTGNWNGIELTESTMSTPCFRLVSWDTPYRYPIGSQMIHSDHVEQETLKLLKINLQPHVRSSQYSVPSQAMHKCA